MNDGARNSGVKTLRAYSEFRRVYATKTRFFRNGLGFCYRRAENLVFRFGISIPKHFGKAVERNKLRRRIKEIIRHCHCIPLYSEIVFCVNRIKGKACDSVRHIGGEVVFAELQKLLKAVERLFMAFQAR